MISLEIYLKHIGADDLATFCGVRYEKKENNLITWYDEILIADEIFSVKANSRLSIPVRSLNFEFALKKIMIVRQTRTVDLSVIRAAIEWVKRNAFDEAGDPANLAQKLGASSYSKLLQTLK